MRHKISVIVPVYKVEAYLKRCVESILNQTYKNLEVILINDGSPDNSGKLCDDFANKDNRVIVIHKKNEGSSCARNAGLDRAKGDYIAFVDSDDHINPSMIETMLNCAIENKLDVVEIIPKKSNSSTVSDNSFLIQDQVTASKRIIETAAFAVWRRLYKTSVISDLRFIPKIIHQDVFYTIDVLNRIEQLGFLKRQLYNYNMDNESIIRSKYSLEKITIGIRATEYIINNTQNGTELQQTVNNYTTHYYTDHYFLLSRNTEFDPNKVFRKKLRRTVKSLISFNNYTLRSLMVVILPYKIMEYISSSYKAIITS